MQGIIFISCNFAMGVFFVGVFSLLGESEVSVIGSCIATRCLSLLGAWCGVGKALHEYHVTQPQIEYFLLQVLRVFITLFPRIN
jgi:hypothetical protein